MTPCFYSQIAVGCFDICPAKEPSRAVNTQPSVPVRARYDAAREGNETINIWTNADALNADASNSLAVRHKLRNRDRYERANNGHKCGIHRTHANYVIGIGPKLKMQTGNSGFNAKIEAEWKRWVVATQFGRKLRQLHRAKSGDGEAVALIISSQKVRHSVKLNLQPIECDRLTSPTFQSDTESYVDGITYDADGIPVFYDILDIHPGAAVTAGALAKFTRYPAKFVCHWYFQERPEQHRGIPEMTSTLNLFPTARRFREATVAAAETAADYSLLIEMGASQDGNDEVAPFTTLPVDKRMMTVTPAGAKAAQLRAEHPATTYDMFNRNILCEESRPISMPYNIAACDSSGYSYSGGQLDHQTYYNSLDIEQQECEFDVVDRVFDAWFAEARNVFGWNFPEDYVPKHEWAWPGRPHNDPVKTARARKIALSTGTATLGRIFAEDGEDFEDSIQEMADEYGLEIDEMRERILNANLASQPSPDSESTRPDRAEEDDVDETEKAEAAYVERLIHGNGNARFTI